LPEEFCNETTDTCDQCVVDGDCDDGDACNGAETCVAGTCQPGTPLVCDDGNACTDDTCDPMLGCQYTLTCTPIVSAVGPRYLAITPPADQPSVALRVESAMLPCLPKYVDATGLLVSSPVFMSSEAWGTVFVSDREIIPFTQYDVRADIRDPMDPENLTPAASATTWRWGDVNDSTIVDVFDIVCVLDGFQDVFENCALEAVDLMGETPDRDVDLFDIMAVLDAYQDIAYPDPMPCTALAVSPRSYEEPSSPLMASKLQLQVQPSLPSVQPGAAFTADVFISGSTELRAYQLSFKTTGGSAGSIVVEDVTVNPVHNAYVFGGLSPFTAKNAAEARVANALQAGAVETGDTAYLATVHLRASVAARGTFRIELEPNGRTILLDANSEVIGGLTLRAGQVQVRNLERQILTPSQRE
ncbi:hypothetical protein B7486_50555, partial [cyanobacterium TDX16]